MPRNQWNQYQDDQYFRYGRIDPEMLPPSTIGNVNPRVNPFGITQRGKMNRTSQSSNVNTRMRVANGLAPVKNTGPMPGDAARNVKTSNNPNWLGNLMNSLSKTVNSLNQQKAAQEDPYSTGMNEGTGLTREDAEDAKMSTGNVGRSFRAKYPKYYQREPGAVPSSFFYNGGNRLP